jgi:hypothetical protein
MVVPESNRIYLEKNTTHKTQPIGTKHSALTITSAPFKRKDAKGIFYECECDCGATTTVSTVRFKFRSTSCGCLGRIRVCKACGKDSNEASFPKTNGAYCSECKPKKRKEYREKHLETLQASELKSYHRDPHASKLRSRNYYHNGGKEKQEARRDASPESFLKTRYQGVKYRGRKVEIGAEYLIKMWYDQKGLCAVSGLPMLHKSGSLFTVSVDRTDSKLDYIEGNIQLVCRCMNLARREHPVEELKEFLDDYYQLRSVLK